MSARNERRRLGGLGPVAASGRGDDVGVVLDGDAARVVARAHAFSLQGGRCRGRGLAARAATHRDRFLSPAPHGAPWTGGLAHPAARLGAPAVFLFRSRRGFGDLFLAFSRPASAKRLRSVGRSPLGGGCHLACRAVGSLFHRGRAARPSGFSHCRCAQFRPYDGGIRGRPDDRGQCPGKTRVASVQLYEFVEAMEYGEAHRLALVLVLFSFAVLVLLNFFGQGKR